MSDPRVIVALDYPDADSALAFVRRVTPQLCRLKVGNELFTAAGPPLIDALTQRGFEVFLDLKYNDIPNTVAAACRAAARHGIWMVNVHALGGRAMLEAASAAVAGSSHPPLLIAVTVLTSLNERDMREVGITGAPRDAALKLAQLAQASGLDGVVCSAEEAALLKRECGAGFRLVTPGIRPAASAQDDQQRVMTPAAAIAAGADYLVVGRPVTQAAEPQVALAAISAEVAGAQRPSDGR